MTWHTKIKMASLAVKSPRNKSKAQENTPVLKANIIPDFYRTMTAASLLQHEHFEVATKGHREDILQAIKLIYFYIFYTVSVPRWSQKNEIIYWCNPYL